MKIAWTVPALVDRRNIYAHIEQQSPAGADAIDNAIIQATQRLQIFPSLGHPGRFKGTRELTFHPSYVLIYRVFGHEVQIVRVLHTARKRS